MHRADMRLTLLLSLLQYAAALRLHPGVRLAPAAGAPSRVCGPHLPVLQQNSEDNTTVSRDMLSIALPAFVGLAIDPVAGMVDTAFIGRCCGTEALAGSGVAISVFNLVSKTFNFLSSATTSQVASASPDASPGEFTAEMIRAASASLTVALVLGCSIAAVLVLGGGSLLGMLRVAPDQLPSARAYLSMRALSAPATLALMTLQGAFRGARDTRTPLGALTLASVLNVVLDWLLIGGMRGGVRGAALATTLSQYAAAGVLCRQLVQRCGESCAVADGPLATLRLLRPRRADCAKVARAGSWLTLRTFTGVGALSFSSVAAASLGAAVGAAHQVAFQLWLAASLLADAVAVAAQALVAAAVARADAPAVRAVMRRTLAFGLAAGVLTALGLASAPTALCRLFTTDAAALAAAAAVWPLVVCTQPLNTLAFAVDGLIFGAQDFTFCALGMAGVSAAAMLPMALAPRFGLRAVWVGLGTFMGLRAAVYLARIQSARGPWALLSERK